MHRIARSIQLADKLGTLIRMLDNDPQKMGIKAPLPKIIVATNPKPAAGQKGEEVDPWTKSRSPKKESKK